MARKTRNDRLSLPRLELRCMKALWALRAGTVHEIRAQLLSERQLAYTTVLTLMDRLARKGIVEREKRGRSHLYRALVAEDQVRELALARLVGDFFQGSREQLRQHLESDGRGEARAATSGFAPARTAAERARSAAREALIDPTLL
jgi:predicted transcriptional regulator